MHKGSISTVLLPPGCQRLWIIDPSYLWSLCRPAFILMDRRDFLDSRYRSRDSPYDFKLHRGMEHLKRRQLLWLYDVDVILGSRWREDLRQDSDQITARVRRLGTEFIIRVASHVFGDYSQYLQDKSRFFYPLPDPYYSQILNTFLSYQAETDRYFDVLARGSLPTDRSLLDILRLQVERILLGYYLTAAHRALNYGCSFYVTWEYLPLVQIVAEHLRLEFSTWCIVQRRESNPKWELLLEVFASLDPKYEDGRLLHFVHTAAEVDLFHEVRVDLELLWDTYAGDRSKIRTAMRRTILDSMEMLALPFGSHLLSGIRATVDDAAALTGTPAPLGIVSRLLSSLRLARMQAKIPAYAFLYLLKSRERLLELPDIHAPFGPATEEERELAEAARAKNRWTDWPARLS